MTPLDQYTRTGRVNLGPGSDLVEMRSASGEVCTAICFHPEYRRHPAINAALGIIVTFLEQPMVPSLTELVACDLTESVFVYPSGPTWSVAELTRSLGDVGEAGGVRAGMELIAAAGAILVEAAEAGEGAGVYSHGGLTPWRILIDPKGGVQIIGHALPQVEILTFHEDPSRIPREDAFRYCPPERMRARKENWSSDIFGLGLIACELMTGRPVYDGLVNDIRTKAARGETSRRIHQFRQHIPEAVRELLATMLSPDFGDRFQGGADFLDFVQHAAGEVPTDGVTLHDITRRVAHHVQRAGADLDPAQTAALSRDQLAAMLGSSVERLPHQRTMDPLTSGDTPRPAPAIGVPAAPTDRIPSPGGVGRPSAARPATRSRPAVSSVLIPAAVVPAAAIPAAAIPAAVIPAAAAGVASRAPVWMASAVDAPGAPRASALPGGPESGRSAVAPVVSPAPSAEPALVARAPRAPSEPLPRVAPPVEGAPAPRGMPQGEPAPAARPAAPRVAPPGATPPAPPASAPPAAAPPAAAFGASAPPAAAFRASTPPAAAPGAPAPPPRLDPPVSASPASRPPPPAVAPPRAASSSASSPNASSADLSGAAPSRAPMAVVPSVSGILNPVSSARWSPPKRARPTTLGGEPAAPSLPETRPLPGPAPAAPPVGPPPVRSFAPIMNAPIAPAPSLAAPSVVAPIVPILNGRGPSSAGGPPGAPPPIGTPSAEPAAPASGVLALPASGAATSEARAADKLARLRGQGEAVVAPVAPAPPASPPASPPPPPAAPARPGLTASSAMPAFEGPGDPVPLLFARPGQAPARRRIAGRATLAQTAGRLVGVLAPLPLGTEGRLSGWYRLGPESGPLPGDMRVGEVPADMPLHLHFVENRSVVMAVEVRTPVPVRMRLPLGTAVPLASVVDALTRLLQLPPGDWAASLDGLPLDGAAILADCTIEVDSQLVVAHP